jgi:hypothetical protein
MVIRKGGDVVDCLSLRRRTARERLDVGDVTVSFEDFNRVIVAKSVNISKI